ncbi:MAG: hypothetical protein OT477_06120 [Chloroflexi bacterium]|nr:hypothetical protein [Chloroflexota bacterium]
MTLYPQQQKSKKRILIVVVTGLLLLGVISCNQQKYFQNMAQNEKADKQPIPLADGNVSLVSWLSEDELVLRIANPDDYFDSHFGIYTLSNGNLHLVPTDHVNPCTGDEYTPARRILSDDPWGNDSFGFIYECYFSEQRRGGRTLENRIYHWNRALNQFELFYTFTDVPMITVTSFSLALDQTVFLESNVSGLFNTGLYKMEPTGEYIQLVPEFFRAAQPSLSPSNQQLAFAGSELAPEVRTSIYSGLPGIDDVLDHPWDLYKMNTDGTDFQLLISGIQKLYEVQWSPNGDLIAFRGLYKGVYGLWVYDLNTTKLGIVYLLEPVYTHQTLFSWSPDGNQIVVLDEDTESALIFIDIPEQFIQIGDN